MKLMVYLRLGKLQGEGNTLLSDKRVEPLWIHVENLKWEGDIDLG